jgi:Na+/proline symporter
MWGVVLTGGALLFREQGTPVVVVALGIASFTYGGLLGVFFLGNFWPRATQRDALLGLSIGILAMAFVVFATRISAAVPALANALGPFAGA